MVVHRSHGLSTAGAGEGARAVWLSTAGHGVSTVWGRFPTGSCTALDPDDQVVDLVEYLTALAHE
jgi:hypothetical protein